MQENINTGVLKNGLDDFLNTSFSCYVFGNYQEYELAQLTINTADPIKKSTYKISDQELCDLAMEGLSKMQLVGTTDKLDQFISRLADMWSLPQPIKSYKQNTNPHSKTYYLSQNQIKRIQELCSVDIRIYEYASQNLY